MKLRPIKVIFIAIIVFIAACDRQESRSIPGYIEGRYTYIATNYGGILQDLSVQRGDEIKAGQSMFVLEPEPESDTLSTTEARIQQAIAQIKSAEGNYALQKLYLNRRSALHSKNVLAKEEVDSALYNYQEATADLSAAKSNLIALQSDFKKAQWTLDQKSGESPVDALVFDTYFTPGELVTNGYPIIALLDPKQIKIVFFVSEKILGKVKLQQKVKVQCDGCSELIEGKIVYISPDAEYTPPVVYSEETRAKLVFRVEAKPLIDMVYSQLHPGQPVSVFLK